jgi:hypothetical protein
VSSERTSAFAMLRSYTKCYRKIGMTFFHGQAAEKDFQRVAKTRKPSPAAVAKTAAKKSAKKVAAAEKKAARKQTAGAA